MIREFFKSLFLQQDQTSLTVYLHVPASAVYLMMVCSSRRIHQNKQLKFYNHFILRVWSLCYKAHQ